MNIKVAISDLKVGMYINAISRSKRRLVVKKQGLIKSEKTINSLAEHGILELEIDLSKSKKDIAEAYQKTSNTNKPTKRDAQEKTNEQATSVHDKSKEDLKSTSSKDRVSIKDIEPESPKKAISEKQHTQDLVKANSLYNSAKNTHNKFIKTLRSGGQPDFDSLQTLSQEIIDSVFENKDALSCLIMLKESNDYLVEHALNCSILLAMFAHNKGMSQAETEDLTLAGMLMDCGMCALPSDLLEKKQNYTESDRSLMRTHVDIGLEIAERFGDFPPIVLDVIENHHERFNGKGYPHMKSGDQISIYAQMAAIVDCYDAMLTAKPYKSAKTAQASIEELQESGMHEEKLVNELIDTIGLHPPGALVKLQSGKLAMVLQSNHENPMRPVVLSFYSIRNKHHTEVKRINLKRFTTDKIVASVTPEEFDISLPKFFKTALLD